MKQEEKTAYHVPGRVGVPVLLAVLTVLAAAGAAAALGRAQQDVLRLTVLSAIGAGCLVFVLLQSRQEHTFLYDNEYHLWRFFGFYTLALVLSVLFAFLPVGGWPYLAVSVALTLFGSELLGTVATAVLLTISTGLCGAQAEVFVLYFLTGVVAVCLFRRVTGELHVFLPSFCSLLLLLVAQTACLVIGMNERLNFGMFVLPTIGLFLNAILLVILLKYFGSAVVNRYRMTYMEINDQEFVLMAQLRQNDREAYYLAIHTGYLCERIAVRLGLDAALCKAGGYYHKLAACSVAEREDLFETLEDKHHFPPAVLLLMEECNREDHRFRTAEAAVVHMADAVVSTIRYLYANNPDADIRYDQVIQSIFERKEKAGQFDRCEITLAQFRKMRDMFLEEKLYYDFLR